MKKLTALFLLLTTAAIAQDKKHHKLGTYNGEDIYYYQAARKSGKESYQYFEIIYKKNKFTGKIKFKERKDKALATFIYTGESNKNKLTGIMNSDIVNLKYGSGLIKGKLSFKDKHKVYELNEQKTKVLLKLKYLKSFKFRSPDVEYVFKYNKKYIIGDDVTKFYSGTASVNELFLFVILMQFEIMINNH